MRRKKARWSEWKNGVWDRWYLVDIFQVYIVFLASHMNVYSKFNKICFDLNSFIHPCADIMLIWKAKVKTSCAWLSGYNSPIYHSCISLFPYLFHCFDSWSASFPGRPKKSKLEESQENDRAQWRRRNARITCNEITGYLKNILCFFSIIFCCSRTIWYVIFHNQNKYCLNNIYVLLVSAIHKSKNRNGVSQSN